MNCSDFEQILNHFNTKIETIYSLIPLSQLYEDINDKQNWNRNAVFDSNHLNYNNSEDFSKRFSDKKPDLKEISQMVIEMKTMTEEMRHLLGHQKQTIVSQSIEYKNDLNRIERHCDHINHNIPDFLHNSKPNKTVGKKSGFVKHPVNNQKNETSKLVPKSNQKPKTTINTNINYKTTQEFGNKNLKKRVIKDMENIPNLSFITTEEFDSIPHYMLGRLTYEVINRAIADINRTITAKYKIIVNYSNKYSDEEMKKYVKFKEQENRETEGQYFCTIEDLKEFSDVKSDPIIRKIVICLRHCKRIREIRGNPPKLVRYALITNQMISN